MNARLTDSDHQRIRAATARLAKQLTPAEIAASKRARVAPLKVIALPEHAGSLEVVR